MLVCTLVHFIDTFFWGFTIGAFIGAFFGWLYGLKEKKNATRSGN